MGTATQAKAPLFTRSALVALIWPLFLEQTLSVTMGMADTLMVSVWARRLCPACRWWTA